MRTELRTRPKSEAGMTLLELMVASTLFALLAVAFSSAWGDFAHMMRFLERGTAVFVDSGVSRSRVFADAQRASGLACSSGEFLSLTNGEQPFQTMVEYSLQEGRFERWSMPPDHSVVVAEGLETLACTDLGDAGVEVKLDFAAKPKRRGLYLAILEVSDGDGDDGDDGDGDEDGKGGKGGDGDEDGKGGKGGDGDEDGKGGKGGDGDEDGKGGKGGDGDKDGKENGGKDDKKK
ncbi:MAG: type II secretion system protein J [Candidatus Binatia bacterium]